MFHLNAEYGNYYEQNAGTQDWRLLLTKTSRERLAPLVDGFD
jgi:hypothetical protein